jgi:hypothetical protein
MTNVKKPIRRWGEAPPASGTMRDLRGLRPPEPAPAKPKEVPPLPAAPAAPPDEPPPVPSPAPIASVIPPAPLSQEVETPISTPVAPQVKLLSAKPSEQPKPLLRKANLILPTGPFEEFRARWKPFLRKGQLRICEVLYQKTHAIGQTHCTTSFSELAVLSGLKLRQCFNVISQLEEMGLVERFRLAKGSNKVHAGSTFYFYLDRKVTNQD